MTRKKKTILGSEPVLAIAGASAAANGGAHSLLHSAGANGLVHVLVHGCLIAGSAVAARSKVTPVSDTAKDPV